MPKPKVWYIQTESHTERVFEPEHYQAMLDEFDVTVNDTGKNLTAEQIAAGIAGYEALVTGWGTPALSEEVLKNGDKLKAIIHTAGSIKYLVSREMIDKYMIPRGMTLFSGNIAIAYNVAESAVGMLLMTMRLWPHMSAYFKRTGNWRCPDIRANGQYLMGSTVGVLAASAVGREVIRLLQPWPLTILLYDPYVSAEQAAAMGAQKVDDLNELFRRADHITVHLPSIPATDKIIGKEQLGLMKPGATLVNTSRGSCIDHDALIEKCKRDEIYVCLDVTTPEPLPKYSEFRMLDNVFITPHVSGSGFYGYHKIGEQAVQALRDVFAGRPVYGAVDYSRYEILA